MRTLRRDREPDDQKVALGKELQYCEVLSGTFMGLMGFSKFVEDLETGLCEETGRCSKVRDQKLQSNSTDIGDVEVVCILYYSLSGWGKRAWNVEESTCWWGGLDKLPAPTSDGYELTAKALGMTG